MPRFPGIPVESAPDPAPRPGGRFGGILVQDSPVAADFSDVRGRVTSTDQMPISAERYAAAGINPNVSPAAGESFLDNAAAGFGASYVDLKDSARQLLANNAARHTGALRNLHEAVGTTGLARDVVYGIDRAASDYQRGVQADIDQRQRIDAPLNDTKSGQLGGILGFASQLLMPAGALRGVGASGSGSVNALARLAGDALLPSTARGAALQGAALGAAQPVATGESRTANAAIGAGAGAAGAALGRVIGATARGTSNAVKSALGRPTASSQMARLAEILRTEAADPARLLTAQPSSIPGVQRTLAEESLDPGIARLERLLRGKGGAWSDLDRVNNSSRVNALGRFAGSNADIAAAKSQRSAAAVPLLDQALEVQGVDSKPVLNALAEIAKKAEGRPAVQNGLSQIGALLRRTAEGAKEGAEKVPEDRLSVLYNVRKTIDDMLSGKYGGDSAAALAGSKELLKVKESLDEALTAASPEFGQYLNAFREGSVPIGRMQIGRELMERGGAVPDAISGETVLTPAQFSRATADLDRVAAKATGFKKAEAGRYLQPEDKATIAGIQDDLQRRSFAATAGSGGNSQTAERLMGDDRLARGAVSKLADRIPLFGAASQYLREQGQQRLENKLAQILMNPAEARSILASVPAEDRRALQIALGRAGGVSGAITADAVEQ